MSIELFAVVRDRHDYETKQPLPEPAFDQEHAQALATVKNKEYPDLGPFRVVKLVEAA